jgi:hypothetical protein
MFTVVSLAPVGCGEQGDGLPRQPVSGEVVFEGKPLALGTIQFLPTSDKQPTMGLAGIKEGKYSIPRARGLVSGQYKVVISSSTGAAEGQEAHGMPGKPGPPPKDIIPHKYNVASSLTVEVNEGQSNPLNFALKQ